MPSSPSKTNKIVLLVAGFLLLATGITFLCERTSEQTNTVVIEPEPTTSTTTVYVPRRTTLAGEYTCLPHKSKTGAKTDECRVALKTSDGNYYAIDTLLLQTIAPTMKSGNHISANGLLTPIENLSSNYWDAYNVQGIFSITDGLRLDERGKK